MVLSLDTMPGASMMNYASYGGLEILSYHQPCQMQSYLSEEIRAICTRMIARCKRMSAMLNEWISTVDALIEEEENQLQLQKQEQTILKSSAIVDVPDIAIKPFHHPIPSVRNCSLEVYCKRYVPNVTPNGESLKKLASNKQTDEEILNQNLDSSSHYKNKVTEQEISTMLNLVTKIKYLCHVRLNWYGIICNIQMVALPEESVEGRESKQTVDGKSILVFDPGDNLFDESTQTNIDYNDFFTSTMQIQINFDLQIDFIRYSNLQLVTAITSGFLRLVVLCSEAMIGIVPATKFTLTVVLVGVEGAKGITLVGNFTALVEVSFELWCEIAHKNVMLLLVLGWSITANFTVSLINRWNITLTKTIEGQASFKVSEHAKQLDLEARITSFLKSSFQDFGNLGKIEKEFAQSLEKLYSQHLSLIEYQQNRSCCPMFIRWFPTLGRVLHFLKTKMLVDRKDDAYEELLVLWEELGTFGFDDLT